MLFIITITLVVKAQKRKPETGVEELIGMEGVAKTDVHNSGQVFVHGEIWEAVSDVPLKAGSKIIIEEVKGLRLKVRSLI